MTVTMKLTAAGICAFAMFWSSNAYTPAETNRVLWQLVNTASPHVDNLTDLQRGIGCVDTRTPRKFFNLPVDGNWTPQEKKAAFDAFLEGMGRHDYSSETNDYRSVTELAVSQCAFMHYTVALPWLKNLILNPTCCQRVRFLADRTVVEMMNLSVENTCFVENVFTNTTVFTPKGRRHLSDLYINKMLVGVTNGLCSASVVESAANRFYGCRKIDSAGGMFFDDLFALGLDGYATSSNRLDFALFMLQRSDCSPYNRRHFTTVTNQLLSSGQTLRWINVGGNE